MGLTGSPGAQHSSHVREGKREELQRGQQLIGTKNNKMDEEGVSEEQGLTLDLVRSKIEQSGEDWPGGEYKELSLSRKESMGQRNWRVCHSIDFKS